MTEYQVTCINKPDRTNIHEHITHIGNLAGQWRMARERAITEIDAKRMAFYTIDRTTGRKMSLGVVREANKAPYLRTHADGKWNDNLLALNDCDQNCKLV